MEINYHTFPKGKSYVYIHTDSGPVFLRNILFLVNTKNPDQIAIVRSWGEEGKDHVWEPPKGQMEWKEFKDKGIKPGSIITEKQLLAHSRIGVLREMAEEANVTQTEIKDLRPLPLSYTEDWSVLKNAKFRYQFWQAYLTPEKMLEAQKRMDILRRNSDWKHILPSDMTEKDAIQWWSVKDGWKKIRGKFSEKMTAQYFKYMDKYGL
jgi:hypothetical protein